MISMKNISILVSICCLFTVLSGCVKNRMMQGYVYESYNRSPVAGVPIQVNEQTITTDKEGAYQIQVGQENKVKVVIQDKRFEEFNDWVVIPEAKNYRDFILDAAHPFGIKAENFVIPTAYSYQLRMGKSETSLQFIGTVDSVTIDEAMRIVGKQYDTNNQLVSVKSIKFGLSGFETDALGFWNMFEVPTDLQLKVSAKESYLLKVAYNFYKDTAYTYEVSKISVTISNAVCTQFTVTEKASGKVIEVFMVQKGPEKGLVKQILQNDTVKKDYAMITFKAFTVEQPIVPPEITE